MRVGGHCPVGLGTDRLAPARFAACMDRSGGGLCNHWPALRDGPARRPCRPPVLPAYRGEIPDSEPLHLDRPPGDCNPHGRWLRGSHTSTGRPWPGAAGPLALVAGAAGSTHLAGVGVRRERTPSPGAIRSAGHQRPDVPDRVPARLCRGPPDPFRLHLAHPLRLRRPRHVRRQLLCQGAIRDGCARM